MGNDGVVFADVEVDEAAQCGDRVELLGEQKPCFMESQNLSIMEFEQRMSSWAMSMNMSPSLSAAATLTLPGAFSPPSSAMIVASGRRGPRMERVSRINDAVSAAVLVFETACATMSLEKLSMIACT